MSGDTPVPTPIRALLAFDAVLRRAQVLVTRAREELFLNCVPPSLREAVTFRIYEGYSLTRGKRAAVYPHELFSWEELLFTSDPFPPTGRILLGAAGGGRELRWFMSRGYAVVAFEPSGLVRDAEAAAGKDPRVRIFRAAYRSFVEQLESGTGDLSSVCAGTAFDAIVLGWGSFSYVYRADERLRLLKALRWSWPQAPIYLSFFLRRDETETPMRRRTRRLLSLLGAPGSPGVGLRFFHESGFAYTFTRAEIERLAAESGYSLARFASTPYPHAVLVAEDSPAVRLRQDHGAADDPLRRAANEAVANSPVVALPTLESTALCVAQAKMARGPSERRASGAEDRDRVSARCETY